MSMSEPASVERWERRFQTGVWHRSWNRGLIALALELAAYSYLLLMFLLCVALFPVLLVVLVYINVLVLIRGMIWAMSFGPLLSLGIFIRTTWAALRAKPQFPGGALLDRKAAPELWKHVDEFSRRFKPAHIKRILLSADPHHSHCLFRNRSSALVIDITAMFALSPDEMRWFLAQQVAQVAQKDNLRNVTLDVIRGIAAQVPKTLDQEIHDYQHYEDKPGRHGKAVTLSLLKAAWQAFFRHYVPMLEAFQAVLGQISQFEADHMAAVISNPRLAARSLLQLEVSARFLRQMGWKGIYDPNNVERAPALAELLGQLQTHFRTGPPPEFASRALTAMLQYRGLVGEKVPCLSNRLHALGFQAPSENAAEWATQEFEVPHALAVSAADHYLKDAQIAMAEVINDWCHRLEPDFRDHVREVKRQRAIEDELRQSLADGPLKESEALALALAVGWRSDEEAIALLRELVERAPQYGLARHYLARILLRHENAEAMATADTLLEEDDSLALITCRMLINYAAQTGRAEEWQRYRGRLKEIERNQMRATAERNNFRPGDPLLPLELSDAELAPLRSLFAEYPNLDKVYIVRRVVTYDAHAPHFVVGLVVITKWWGLNTWSESELADFAKWVNCLVRPY
jgi:hypothetical protein